MGSVRRSARRSRWRGRLHLPGSSRLISDDLPSGASLAVEELLDEGAAAASGRVREGDGLVRVGRSLTLLGALQ